MNYTYYDSFGRLFTFFCSDENVLATMDSIHPNLTRIEGEYAADKYYYDHGIKEIPEKPNELSIFDYSVKEWVDRDLQQTKLRVKEQLNSKASDIIFSTFPQWKQLNMTSRALELSMKTTLSSSEQNELTQIQSSWDWISSVREASNIAASSVDSANSIADILMIQSNAYITF